MFFLERMNNTARLLWLAQTLLLDLTLQSLTCSVAYAHSACVQMFPVTYETPWMSFQKKTKSIIFWKKWNDFFLWSNGFTKHIFNTVLKNLILSDHKDTVNKQSILVFLVSVWLIISPSIDDF